LIITYIYPVDGFSSSRYHEALFTVAAAYTTHWHMPISIRDRVRNNSFPFYDLNTGERGYSRPEQGACIDHGD
jgi:hypothetical protein